MPHKALEIKLRLQCLPVFPSGLTWCRTDPARPDPYQQEMLPILK